MFALETAASIVAQVLLQNDTSIHADLIFPTFFHVSLIRHVHALFNPQDLP